MLNFFSVRTKAGVSLEQLSIRTGIDEIILRNLEKGEILSVSCGTLVAVAEALGCLVDDLFSVNR